MLWADRPRGRRSPTEAGPQAAQISLLPGRHPVCRSRGTTAPRNYCLRCVARACCGRLAGLQGVLSEDRGPVVSKTTHLVSCPSLKRTRLFQDLLFVAAWGYLLLTAVRPTFSGEVFGPPVLVSASLLSIARPLLAGSAIYPACVRASALVVASPLGASQPEPPFSFLRLFLVSMNGFPPSPLSEVLVAKSRCWLPADRVILGKLGCISWDSICFISRRPPAIRRHSRFWTSVKRAAVPWAHLGSSCRHIRQVSLLGLFHAVAGTPDTFAVDAFAVADTPDTLPRARWFAGGDCPHLRHSSVLRRRMLLFRPISLVGPHLPRSLRGSRLLR